MCAFACLPQKKRDSKRETVRKSENTRENVELLDYSPNEPGHVQQNRCFSEFVFVLPDFFSDHILSTSFFRPLNFSKSKNSMVFRKCKGRARFRIINQSCSLPPRQRVNLTDVGIWIMLDDATLLHDKARTVS